ncbi:GIY-YIG nuclease family protein [Sinobaca sp. H24]|uniref:GIY-YIG nuclease family protein n=1 Tax=Sinobaca sp. H24 TaxID=2923376 RepID=UPI0020793F1C|nr:GIY-YIG nuclease family protein [Sinobaca sp. H24]
MKEATKQYYVYILLCADATLYTGYTDNVEKRIAAHAAGKGAKYTRGRGPFILVHEEMFFTKREALQREREIKSWNRQRKKMLIDQNRGGRHETTT